MFAAKADQAFNVELVLRQAVDVFGLEDDDLAAFGLAEIVSHPINEQMVAADNAQLDQVFALFEFARDNTSNPIDKAGAEKEILRRKPDGVCLARKSERLL